MGVWGSLEGYTNLSSGLSPKKVSKMEERKILTIEDIENGKTKNGGWTKATLAGWGISWPPPKGWKSLLLGEEPKDEPESHPDCIESILLHEVVMAVISAGQGDILKEIEGLNSYYNCKIPTVADIVGGRPKMAIIEGGITFDDKVYRFSVARKVK